MTRSITIAVFLLVLVVVIVGVDVAFFRDHFWERFISNIGIVLVFIAIWFRFFN